MDDKWVPDDQLDEWFGYHTPSSPEITKAHQTVRTACRDLAQVLSDLLPECPDKTTALNAVRVVMYKANACIAVQQRLYGDEDDEL
jgi:hypothetical protein